MVAGVRYVGARPLIWTLMRAGPGADRVRGLPGAAAGAGRRLGIGPTGYGLLSAAPSLGALLATYAIVRLVMYSRRLGRVLLVSTSGYGVAAVCFAQLAGGRRWRCWPRCCSGAFDATATTIRHTAVQIDTPDELRGRVRSLYQISSRGGPALGDVVIGAVAGVSGRWSR